MGTKAERRAASERGAAYHEARLGELIEYITAAIDRYRAGEIDAYTVDDDYPPLSPGGPRAVDILLVTVRRNGLRPARRCCGRWTVGAGTGVSARRRLRSHGRAVAWWRCRDPNRKTNNMLSPPRPDFFRSK